MAGEATGMGSTAAGVTGIVSCQETELLSSGRATPASEPSLQPHHLSFSVAYFTCHSPCSPDCSDGWMSFPCLSDPQSRFALSIPLLVGLLFTAMQIMLQ